MHALQMRCHGQACQDDGWPKHCRATFLVPHGDPPVLPDREGAPVPSPVREQVLGHAPFLCSQANTGHCQLSVLADPELDKAVHALHDYLRQSSVFWSATGWLECAVRSPDDVPEHVREALREVPGGIDALELVATRSQRLMYTMTAHPLN